MATASHLLVGGGPDGEGDVAMEPREFLGRSVRPPPPRMKDFLPFSMVGNKQKRLK
jgi:hypothetical protein